MGACTNDVCSNFEPLPLDSTKSTQPSFFLLDFDYPLPSPGEDVICASRLFGMGTMCLNVSYQHKLVSYRIIPRFCRFYS